MSMSYKAGTLSIKRVYLYILGHPNCTLKSIISHYYRIVNNKKIEDSLQFLIWIGIVIKEKKDCETWKYRVRDDFNEKKASI